MKLCTLFRVTEGYCGVVMGGEIVDVSFVADDHQFGWDDEQPDYLHIEGTDVQDEPV